MCIGARVRVNEYSGVCHLNVSLSEVVYQPRKKREKKEAGVGYS